MCGLPSPTPTPLVIASRVSRCYNWCGSDCSSNFGDYTSAWSSMHFMLRDHSLNTCPEHCASGSGSASSAADAVALPAPFTHSHSLRRH